MTRYRRRQEVLELAQRYKNLSPEGTEQVSRVGLVLVGNALMSSLLQLGLLAMYVQAIRRLRANRHHGWRVATAAARARPALLGTCLYGCYAVSAKVLLLRWAKRVVKRVERGTKASDEEPSP